MRPIMKDVTEDLNHYKGIADKMAEKYGEPFMVTCNIRDEYGVYPARQVVGKTNEIRYVTNEKTPE